MTVIKYLSYNINTACDVYTNRVPRGVLLYVTMLTV